MPVKIISNIMKAFSFIVLEFDALYYKKITKDKIKLTDNQF